MMPGYTFHGNVLAALNCHDPEVILSGPADCIAGETLIDVPGRGRVSVEALHKEGKSFPVMTMQGITQADAPFVKGTAALYKVTTADGRAFTATKQHRVLTSSGWTFVDDLVDGVQIPVCDAFHLLSSLALDPPMFQQDARHSSHKVSSSQVCYFDGYRRGDGQFQCELDTCQVPVPSQVGVHAYNHADCRMDDLGNELEHSRLCRSADHRANWSYDPLTGCREYNLFGVFRDILLRDDGLFQLDDRFQKASVSAQQVKRQDRDFDGRRYHTSWLRECLPCSTNSVHEDRSFLDIQQLLLRHAFFCELNKSDQFAPDSDACNPSLSSPPNLYYTVQPTTVSSITFEREDLYYDLHVPRAGHYLADGFFHHNTGKTFGMLWKLHKCACKYPGAQISIIRKVKHDLHGAAIQTYTRDILEKFAPWVEPYGGKMPQWFDYPKGSRIWLGGLDDPGKTLSSERDLVYVNQAEEITMSDWEYLTRVTTGRGAVVPFPQLLGDCNPAGRQHWLLQRRDAGKLTFFSSTHRDNPTLYNRDGTLTPDGEKRLSRLRNLTGHRLKRLYYGLWAPPEGAIYSMYDEERHKVESFPIPRLWPRFVGVDPFGAKIAAVWLAYDPQGQVLHVYREYSQPFGVTTGEHVKAILAASGYTEFRSPLKGAETIFAWVGGGPSERQQRVDFGGFGLPLVPSPVTDVWAGIDRVSSLLDEGGLVIHDCCVELLSEIGEMQRKENKKTGEFTDQIENKNDWHLCDSLRYVAGWLTGSGEETQDQLVNVSVPIGPGY